MKKFFFFLAAAIALIACQRESGITENTAQKTRTVTIQAGFEATKTAYNEAGKFSWSAGDIIGVVCNGPEGQVVVPFTTQESGPVVTFTGELAEGLTLHDLASYPYTQTMDGYACNDFAYDPSNGAFRLWGSVKPSLTDPLSSMPLLGTKDADGFYQFKSAAGAVKFTVENVPAETAYAYLEVPADTKSSSNLNGWYAVSADDGMIHMTSSIDPWTDRYNWNAPTDFNQTMEYWFFIPDGILPAGTKFELCNSSWAAIESFTFKSDVQVVRNAVVNIEPIVLDAMKLYTLEDIIGTYEVTVTSHSYGSSSEPGDIVLEASDDEANGNVMMTMFAGVSGKQYGTFDGKYITFPKDQIFGANPFSDAETKPYVALDFFNEGVVDARFEVLGTGKIQAVGCEACGLRTCTEEDWANNHGGSWPWAVAYGSLTASFKKDADWKSLGTGRFRDNFVWTFAGLTDYAQVEFQQDVNHDGLFRIAKPYLGDNSGEWFVFNVSDAKAVASEPYFVDIEVTAEGKATFKPWVRNGDYGYFFCNVLNWQQEGILPANVEIGPCYRGDGFGTDNYDYEIGFDHQERAIEIVFPGCEPFQYEALAGDVSDVVGDYSVEYVDYWNNTGTTTISISASDDSSKGNIMITAYANRTLGDPAACSYIYGTYSDGTMVFTDPSSALPLTFDANGAGHTLANYQGGDVKFTVKEPGLFVLHSDMWIIGDRWATTENSGFDTFWTSFKATRRVA